VDRKFDEIVDFSGVEKFIDTPVKRYSSGMYVRLAFAVAAHLDPEILVVDEVLAVGDAEFQKKCLGKMGDVAGEGRTVLFVSHNMGAVQNLCVKGILLHNGEIKYKGNIEQTVNDYLGTIKNNIDSELINHHHAGTGQMRFTKTWVEDINGNKLESVRIGQPFQIIAEYQVANKIIVRNPRIAIAVRDNMGNYLTDLWNQGAGYDWDELPSKGRIVCKIPKCPFNEGVYYYNLYCASQRTVLDFVRDAGKFNVDWGDFFGTRKLPSPRAGKLLINQEWQLIEENQNS